MIHFDFTFDCPVHLLRSDEGFLLGEHALPIWTDVDAAETFIERSPCLDRLALAEIETDDDLLALLTEAQQDGILEVAVDVTSADQTTVRMLYTADLLDMLRERIADG
jgi:hypothetical protein